MNIHGIVCLGTYLCSCYLIQFYKINTMPRENLRNIKIILKNLPLLFTIIQKPFCKTDRF